MELLSNYSPHFLGEWLIVLLLTHFLTKKNVDVSKNPFMLQTDLLRTTTIKKKSQEKMTGNFSFAF